MFASEDEDNISDIKIDQLLSKTQKQYIRNILGKFESIFTKKPGKYQLTEHSIRTTSEKPISFKQYRLSVYRRLAVKQEPDSMLERITFITKNSWNELSLLPHAL